jgi:REP element-mobilizing transposase RayT
MVDRYPRRRNRLRYPGYDYAQPGAIFVTLWTEDRQSLFGSVDEGRMVMNAIGEMVDACWHWIPSRFPAIGIDAWVVMPDHLHGILFPGSDPIQQEPSSSVGDVVRWFKNATIRAYRDGVRTEGWEPYDRHLWQDKFHDRIIRSEIELETVRAYIVGNPGRWWERHLADQSETMST